MTSVLYIIGNGFDLYHGIKSKYSDFKEYLKKSNYDVFECVDKYLSVKEDWSDFEEALAKLNIDDILDLTECYLIDYGAEDWSDSYHHDYQYEMNKIIENLTVKLKNEFRNWIQQLDILMPETSLFLKLHNNAYYLNFNYTPALKRFYDIPSTNIFHIHGKLVESEQLIYGYSIQQPTINAYSEARGEIRTKDDLYLREDDENEDPRVVEGRDIIKNYFLETYKNSDKIIKENITFFQNLKNISEIYILGHSLGDGDMAYLREIIKYINKLSTKWYITYHNEDNKDNFCNKISNLGIDIGMIQMKKIGEFKKI